MIKTLISRLFLYCALASTFALTSAHVYALDTDHQEVLDLIAEKEAPSGVVFELIGDEGYYLVHALEKVKNYTEQLRKKFPKLDIAVVSHGAEQFNLTTSNKTKAKDAHEHVQQLVDSDIPVHVCETHASWRGVTPEDFPDYINVSSTGPAQIRMYQGLGYTLVVIE